MYLIHRHLIHRLFQCLLSLKAHLIFRICFSLPPIEFIESFWFVVCFVGFYSVVGYHKHS